MIVQASIHRTRTRQRVGSQDVLGAQLQHLSLYGYGTGREDR